MTQFQKEKPASFLLFSVLYVCIYLHSRWPSPHQTNSQESVMWFQTPMRNQPKPTFMFTWDQHNSNVTETAGDRNSIREPIMTSRADIHCTLKHIYSWNISTLITQSMIISWIKSSVCDITWSEPWGHFLSSLVVGLLWADSPSLEFSMGCSFVGVSWAGKRRHKELSDGIKVTSLTHYHSKLYLTFHCSEKQQQLECETNMQHFIWF